MISGSFVAIITPFKDDRIDEPSLRRLVDWHAKQGTSGIVVAGTTGESATLSHAEHIEVVRIVREEAGERVPVIAGTGSNATWEAVELTRGAERLKVAASLLITPYYNKPTQEGLYRHFKKIAEETSLPIILYNVPGRTAVNILPETVARLAETRNIIGIKEACGNIEQIKKVRSLCGPDFLILSGEDGQNFEIMELGGRGTISVTANVVPQKMASFCRAMNEGRIEEGHSLQRELDPLHKAMFFETNPIPAKTALSMMGWCTGEMRLPLCAMSTENRTRLQDVLRKFGLIS